MLNAIHRRHLLRRLLKWLARCLVAFIAVSVFLVLLFRWLTPPLSSFMIQRYIHAAWLSQGASPALHYDWVSYKAISPYLGLAVVAGEDQKFPYHQGFDLQSIQQALEDSTRGKSLRGASTISQQVVKNLYLWHGHSWLRKGLEAWLTVLVELFWPKRRILEVYLNIVELGEQTYGAQAASWRFFRKPARRLTREEAALLAAVLPNPLEYRADAPSAYVRERQLWILRQMQRLGGVSYIEQL